MKTNTKILATSVIIKTSFALFKSKDKMGALKTTTCNAQSLERDIMQFGKILKQSRTKLHNLSLYTIYNACGFFKPTGVLLQRNMGSHLFFKHVLVCK